MSKKRSISRSELVRQKCVITDANILINFTKIGREDILRQLRIASFREVL